MPSKFLVFLLSVVISFSSVELCQADRSLDAVLHPEKYPAFEGISDSKGFNEAWEKKSKWVLSNLSHVAYYDKNKLCKTLVPFLGKSTPCYYAKEKAAGENSQAPVIRVYDEGTAQGFLAVWPDKAILSFRGTESTSVDDILTDLSLATTSDGSSNFFKVASVVAKSFIKSVGSLWKNRGAGSKDLKDLFTEFKSVTAEDGAAQVHSGFKKSVDLLWRQIKADLDYYGKARPVWVTGHSLGAAMAVVAGMRYEFEDVVTFGEPRVGYNIKLKAKRHTRIVNGNDPVTMIPPPFWRRYEHRVNPETICDPANGADIRYDHAITDYSKFLIHNGCKN